MLLSAATFAQTIRRVNNNPAVTGTNIYSTVQAAHDAAVNGDIIYVEGSTVSYGDLNSTKSLTWIGTGYYLNPNILTSTLGAVTFKTGSQNSTISGFIVTGNISILKVSNITISRIASLPSIRNIFVDCNDASTFASISNITLIGNYNFDIRLVPRTNASINYTVSNVIIKNNLLGGLYYDVVPNLVVSTVVSNNIIGFIGTVHNTSFQNNISHVQTAAGTFINCSVTNNVALGGPWPSGNNNINNITNPFVQINPPVDTGWQLKPGSAASGAGVGGIDCGIFGGDTPYVLSGIPNYPTITNFITSGTASSATPLGVTISTKSNN